MRTVLTQKPVEIREKQPVSAVAALGTSRASTWWSVTGRKPRRPRPHVFPLPFFINLSSYLRVPRSLGSRPGVGFKPNLVGRFPAIPSPLPPCVRLRLSPGLLGPRRNDRFEFPRTSSEESRVCGTRSGSFGSRTWSSAFRHPIPSPSPAFGSGRLPDSSDPVRRHRSRSRLKAPAASLVSRPYLPHARRGGYLDHLGEVS